MPSYLSFLRRSIESKLAAIVATAVLSAMLLATLVSVWREAEREVASERAELLAVSAAISSAIAHHIDKGDKQEVLASLRAIARIPDITFAQVIDTDGHTIAELGDGGVLLSTPDGTGPKRLEDPFDLVSGGVGVMETPIIRGGLAIGTMRLHSDLSRKRRDFMLSIRDALLAGLSAALFGIAVTKGLQRSITGPINRLTEAMQDVRRSHDFDRSVIRDSDDETGMLVDAFNDMLRQIRIRDGQLDRHRENLENEVKRRTEELNEAMLAARTANSAKSDFLAMMSHEIRTPMNGMMVMAELLAAAEMPPEQKRSVEVIRRSGTSLLTIINDILDLSKIEAGRLDLETIEVDPREVVGNVLGLFSQRAAEIGVDLAADVAPDVPRTILADPVRLTQVLANLVSNALKFTMSGSVVIEVAEAGQGRADGRRHLALSVRDTGIGIAADKLEAIFDAFTQASQSTTRQFGGTGIGLTICRRLVGAMGGTISVASEPGKGSTFRVEAPFEVVEPERPIAVPAANQRRVVVALAGSATRNVVTKALVARGIAARPVDPLDPASVAAACGFGDPSLPPLAAFIADDGRALPLMRMLCGGALEKTRLARPATACDGDRAWNAFASEQRSRAGRYRVAGADPAGRSRPVRGPACRRHAVLGADTGADGGQRCPDAGLAAKCARAGGRRQPRQSRGDVGGARPARPPRDARGKWPRGARAARLGAIRHRLHGSQHAGDGWSRGDAADPCERGGERPPAPAGDRRDGACRGAPDIGMAGGGPQRFRHEAVHAGAHRRGDRSLVGGRRWPRA
ncbi:MAG: ATP-binding protein [Hyphomicrobiaceae bacterium]